MNALIIRTEAFVQAELAHYDAGHDWWHISRVRQTARHIATEEQADLFLVEMAALLHDVGDWKFSGSDTAGLEITRNFLLTLDLETPTINTICQIIREVTFKGAHVSTQPSSLEAQIVQDADRLDALGAIGIARTFSYGGKKDREMYNPTITPVLHDSFEAYQQNTSPTINHFYEKLLLLKDLMNTPTGKAMAAQRHAFMEQYLEQFYQEWEGLR